MDAPQPGPASGHSFQGFQSTVGVGGIGVRVDYPPTAMEKAMMCDLVSSLRDGTHDVWMPQGGPAGNAEHGADLVPGEDLQQARDAHQRSVGPVRHDGHSDQRAEQGLQAAERAEYHSTGRSHHRNRAPISAPFAAVGES